MYDRKEMAQMLAANDSDIACSATGFFRWYCDECPINRYIEIDKDGNDIELGACANGKAQEYAKDWLSINYEVENEDR